MSKPLNPPRKLFNNVAKFRMSVGLSQSLLAYRVGVNRSNIFKIENGLVIPSVLTALRIAECLKVSVHDLFTLENIQVLTEAEKFDLYVEEILNETKM
jgi:putative transcriptional regulator